MENQQILIPKLEDNIKLTYCCSLCGIKEITGEDVLASK